MHAHIRVEAAWAIGRCERDLSISEANVQALQCLNKIGSWQCHVS
jgi:hypothetical protein